MIGVNTRARNHGRGFTLAALLSTIVIISLVLGVLSQSVRNARTKSIQLKCSNNLRQLGLAAQMYAENEGRGRFPDCSNGVWPWDIPGPAANGLLKHGATRELFYCPGVPEQNNDGLWNFTAGAEGTSGFRVIGYALAFRGAGRVRPTNITESLSPQPYRLGNTEVQPSPAHRTIIADATLSIGSTETDRSRNRYTRIFGGSSIPHRSAHLSGQMPSGGNLVFLDNHTEWRPFQKMRVRTEGDPAFWW